MNIADAIVQWILANLTPWTAWQNRAQIAGIDLAGVYLIAESADLGPRDVFDHRVVCIGYTAGALRFRLDEFDSSAFGTGNSHGPALRHHSRGGAVANSLYVSVLPLDLQEPWRSIVPPVLEDLLFWAYKEHNGDLPLDNQNAKNLWKFGKKGNRP